MTVYYVSPPNGNDLNVGTEIAPFRTVAKANSRALPGDTVVLRDGVYSERVVLDKSGVDKSPIVFVAYTNEKPIVDGTGLGLTLYDPLFKMTGSYLKVMGVEVRNSGGMGMVSAGKYNVVDHAFSHNHQSNGILVTGDYGLVQNSRVNLVCLSNENNKATTWASGLTAARSPIGVTFLNNEVWRIWGEGLSAYECTQFTAKGNRVYDSFTANIYISNVDTALVEGNIVYMTPGSPTSNPAYANVGIMLGDERSTPLLAYIRVINNIAVGNRRNLYWWKSTYTSGMNNFLIAYNTFAESISTITNVQLNDGVHVNTRFTSNIVKQSSNIPISYISPSVPMDHNIFSKKSTVWTTGADTMIGDPGFIGGPDIYSPDYYRVTDTSPVIGKGASIPEVVTDYYGAGRTLMDIGAIQHSNPIIINTPPDPTPTIDYGVLISGLKNDLQVATVTLQNQITMLTEEVEALSADVTKLDVQLLNTETQLDDAIARLINLENWRKS